MSKQPPQIDRLRELFIVDTEAGTIINRTYRCGRAVAGAVPGGVGKDGYHTMTVDGRACKAHHIIWCCATGKWPEGKLDHEDTNRSNNRFKNLRPANSSENGQNQTKAHAHSATGILGVHWDKQKELFEATLRLKGRRVFREFHPTAELAQAAYLAAKARLHPFQTITKARP